MGATAHPCVFYALAIGKGIKPVTGVVAKHCHCARDNSAPPRVRINCVEGFVLCLLGRGSHI